MNDLALGCGANRLDDHSGILALDEVAEGTGRERLAHDVGLGVGAHEHDLARPST